MKKGPKILVYCCQNGSRVRNVSFNHNPLDLEEEAPLDLAVPLMGYAAPVVIFLTLVLNAVVVVVLTRRRLRSPTNVILVSIAACDTFTALFSLPGYMYTYTYEGYRNYPSMGWCFVLIYLCRFTPQVLHTVSLWLTALLAFQRYVGVAQMVCKAWISSYKGVTLSIVFLAILSFISHCFQLVLVPRPLTLACEGCDSVVKVLNTCFLHSYNDTYLTRVDTLLRLILAQLLPCFLLLAFNVCLIRSTYKSHRYMQRLVVGHKPSEYTDTRNTIRISLMLLLVTCFTWIFEMFVNLNLVLNYAHDVVSPDTLSSLVLICNFTTLLSFPLNFVFYFTFSFNFRGGILSFVKTRLKRKLAPRKVTSGGDGRRGNTYVFSLIHLHKKSTGTDE
ncbi:sex peptide receptor-like isoform X2 [Haliotis rufescens]|uniref:sex peptide receptor-like isoform X2 n=1 Tax=Haliotis rufescens TaxID=6454 RepID=UPI00201E8268|nr:sex peptide receptor-like isoform X2 [Haliotis rufescens]